MGTRKSFLHISSMNLRKETLKLGQEPVVLTCTHILDVLQYGLTVTLIH